MNLSELTKLYDFSGKTAIVTGGAGVLGSEIARTLAGMNANIVILDRNLTLAEKVIVNLPKGANGQALAVYGDVLDKIVLEQALEKIKAAFGRIDILINAAGGNHPSATTTPDKPFFDLPQDALGFVFDLNIIGTILPSQIIGKQMAEQGAGVILNISSMNAFRPLTRIPAYSAAKAGVSNFTQWLAVHMAQEYSPKIRVNAIAPGFFVGNQNKALLYHEDGSLTARGQQIVDHTPMGRFGKAAELLGTVLWLLSPASQFVTGIIVPVDGGFSAFSGV